MLELLYKRRSIRKFKDLAISTEIRGKLIRSLLLSPSSRNKCPWRFVLIEDRSLITRTAEAKAHGTSALDSSPLAVAVVGLTDISDVWIEDCSIASILVQLEAESLGLGSCWIQIRNRMRADGSSSEEYLRNLLGLSDSETVEAVIAIGHPAESHPTRTDEDLDFGKIEEKQ